jgi:hypothetical protein
MHHITDENYYEVNDVIRDILLMYVDMIESYRGFGHNIQTGAFKPMVYLDSLLCEPEGYSFDIDMKLLQSGSAICLLCFLSDILDETDEWNLDSPFMIEISIAFKAKRFSQFPEIEKAFQLALLENETEFRKQLNIVYKCYVVEYFIVLLKDS